MTLGSPSYQQIPAGELLKEAKSFLEDGLVAPQIIKAGRLNLGPSP